MPIGPARKPGNLRYARRVAGLVLGVAERKAAQDRLRLVSDLYAALYQVNQAILRCRTPEELFQDTVRICVDLGHFDLAWIGVAEPSTGRLRAAAAAGPCLAYLDGLDIPLGAARPEGRGPTATGLREGRAIIVQDWATDPWIEPWRERAAPYGFQASATFPIFERARTVAVLTLYAKVRDFFLPERLRLLDALLGDLGFALDKLAAVQQRAEAEQALHDSEERFRAAFDRAVSAKSMATPDGHLVRVNEAYCRMMGYSEGELEGTSFFELTHPEDRSGTAAFIGSMLAGAVAGHREEKRYLHKDGHVVWGDMATALIRDAAGTPRYFVADLVDITERKALELALQRLNQDLELRVEERTRQLEAANQDLETFAYGVSHDLRAPLRSLAGFSELLTTPGMDLPEATRRDFLQRIHASALRMSRIIDDLLRLARVGYDDLNRVPLDLASLARKVFTRLQEGDPARRVELALSGPIMVQADARLVQVLVVNLLENAWKFTAREAQARIAIGRDPAQGNAVFVQDNGVGFPMAQAGRIFAPFQRLHKATEFPGTGIGLALADRVVRRHGGRIWAQSEPGQGATIFFTLEEVPI